jgi:GT2 family glycosyltransferase
VTRIGMVEIDFATDEPVVQRIDDPPAPARYLLISRVGPAVVDTTYTAVQDTRPDDDELVATARAAAADAVSRRRQRPVPTRPPSTPPESVPDSRPVVVLCTHSNPDGLRRLLDSLARQTVRQFDIVVVDNAPGQGDVEAVVTAAPLPDGIRATYVAEPRAGLSIARNTGWRAVEDVLSVVAWLDDDEIAEPHWLEGLLTAFAETPAAWAVSGTVLPAELETPAQQLFEVYGGHSKGRAFVRETFTSDTVNPLLPLPPFGVGANFAAYAWVYRAVGGFDEALGAGTATKGGEDTLFFTQVLLAGGAVVYEPTAITRHRHRREMTQLAAQFVGYGRGLTAFYVALLCWRPRLIGALLRSVPAAVRALRGTAELHRSDMGLELPADITRGKYLGYLAGPVVYLRLRLAAALRPVARGRHGRR